LTELINKHKLSAETNTPADILADTMVDHLLATEKAINDRIDYYKLSESEKDGLAIARAAALSN
jgi:hypothetical protein